MKYDEIRPLLNTGDPVLCSGHGFFSNQIRTITNSMFSHVGIVLKIPEYNMILLFESTTIGRVKDVESGKEKRGVQLVPLREKIRQYNGEVYIKSLVVDRTITMVDNLMAFRHEVKDRPYEKDFIELIKSTYDGWGGMNTEDLNSIFCSELVAEAYQRMGLLSHDKPSNEYTPADFANMKQLLKGYLTPGVRVTV